MTYDELFKMVHVAYCKWLEAKAIQCLSYDELVEKWPKLTQFEHYDIIRRANNYLPDEYKGRLKLCIYYHRIILLDTASFIRVKTPRRTRPPKISKLPEVK